MQESNKTEKRNERNELEIATEILRAAARGMKKDEIVRRCSLSQTLLEKYLYALLELDLLETEQENEESYRTTEKGLEILRIYHYLKSFIGVKTVDFLLVRMLGRLVTNKKERRVKWSSQRYIV